MVSAAMTCTGITAIWSDDRRSEWKKKVKIGAVAWGLPGGGTYAARTARAAGLDGIQLELGSYEAGYPLAQREAEGYLEDKKSSTA